MVLIYLIGGGAKKIESRKLDWETQSKVGSTNNIKHKPGGGNVKVSRLKETVSLKIQK